MWRVDFGKSHLVDMDVNPEYSFCGVHAPFTTSGSADFDPCKRCLRGVRVGTLVVTPYAPPPPEYAHLWPWCKARGA